MTRFTIIALTLVVIGSLFSPPAKALILTGPPASGVCQTKDYVRAETFAKSRREGLWRGEFEPPWEWRKNR